MKTILAILFLIASTSCTKEKSTNYYAHLKNKTAHKIVIKPYFQGVVPTDKIITLLSHLS